MGKDIVLALANDTFRPYLSDDITGVEVGGAVKNVMAIAGGIVAGKKLGDNAKAALITRGLAEIMRLSEALGVITSYSIHYTKLYDLLLKLFLVKPQFF